MRPAVVGCSLMPHGDKGIPNCRVGNVNDRVHDSDNDVRAIEYTASRLEWPT